MKIYINRHGREDGPFSGAEILEQIRYGGLSPDQPVRLDGHSNYVPFSSLVANVDTKELTEVSVSAVSNEPSAVGTLTSNQYTDTQNLAGVKGWLAWLCVTLTTLIPLNLIVQLLKLKALNDLMVKFNPDYSDVANSVFWLVAITSIPLIVFSVIAGTLLIRRNRNAVSVAKIFTAVLPGAHIFVYATSTIITGSDFFTQAIPGGLPVSIVFFAIWFPYLSYSKRVKVTYNVESQINLTYPGGTQSKPQTKKRAPLKKKTKILITAIPSWIVFVMIRTSDQHYLLGIEFDRWDPDNFFANLTIPPVLIFGAYKTYKWINAAEKDPQK
jgi:hypothetical protein